MIWFEFTPGRGGPLAAVVARVYEQPADSLRMRSFLVDSGASLNLAPASWCPERLLRGRTPKNTGLFDASGNPIAGSDVELYVDVDGLPRPVWTTVWFCEQMRSDRWGLLGLNGWFNMFHVRFQNFATRDRPARFGLFESGARTS